MSMATFSLDARCCPRTCRMPSCGKLVRCKGSCVLLVGLREPVAKHVLDDMNTFLIRRAAVADHHFIVVSVAGYQVG